MLLVVDDDERNRDMLTRRLARRGYEVREAENGERALEVVASEPIDLVLLDIMMPVMDGIETLRRLRETRAPTDLPVIMATAKGESEDVVEALQLGANDYVTKPIDFAVAVARVETHLGMRRAVEKIRGLEASLAERNRELEGLNSRLSESNEKMRRDLEAAARIQQTFLPSEIPEFPGVDFAWKYVPCDELAGDTLSIIPLDENRIGLLVLDVSGHGVPAALLSVTLSRLFAPRSDAASLVWTGEGDGRQVASPVDVVKRLVQRFPADPATRQYFTLVYGILDLPSRRFEYVCAGHPGPVHVRIDGGAEVLAASGVPVGLLPAGVAPPPAQGRLDLAPGDRLYLYTDGIPEAAGPEDEEFGRDRLAALLSDCRERPLAAAVEAAVTAVEEWSGERGLADDVSVLAFQVD